MRHSPGKLLSLPVAALLAVIPLALLAQEQTSPEINAALMQATFRIEGQGSKGTAFLLGRPFTKDPRSLRAVLVTAAHVLSDIQGESATVYYRRRSGPVGWEVIPTPIRIRRGSAPLWTQHPTADIAVMYVGAPEGVWNQGLVPTTLLADDKRIEEYGIHPGDEVICLGYPLGDQSRPYGFPILRSGRIASYPLLPTRESKVFLLDFPVFPGNSGGPVYFVFTGMRGGALHFGQKLLIMGLVATEHVVANRVPLGIAEVVHASLITEAIELLPPPDQE